MAIDPNSLPRDAETLRKIVVDLAEQLDRSQAEQNKYQTLLRELLEAQRNRKSEQLSKQQLALFEAAWQARSLEDESGAACEDGDDLDGDAGTGVKPNETPPKKRGGRQPLAGHLKRERILHDLAEAQRHCHDCGKDLRLIAEETSERYEYVPASMKVIQDVCLKYACDCTVRTATKPPQPIEKSTAGASLLSQVIVAKWADHQPLHRQERMFERHGIEISTGSVPSNGIRACRSSESSFGSAQVKAGAYATLTRLMLDLRCVSPVVPFARARPSVKASSCR